MDATALRPPKWCGPIAEVVQPTASTCLSACIASILGVPIHHTPTVALKEADWFERFNAELRDLLGFELASLEPEPAFGGYWIAVVPSKNLDAPGGHAVVMRGEELVWDPTQGERYETVDMAEVSGALFLLPLQPTMLKPAQ